MVAFSLDYLKGELEPVWVPSKLGKQVTFLFLRRNRNQDLNLRTPWPACSREWHYRIITPSRRFQAYFSLISVKYWCFFVCFQPSSGIQTSPATVVHGTTLQNAAFPRHTRNRQTFHGKTEHNKVWLFHWFFFFFVCSKSGWRKLVLAVLVFFLNFLHWFKVQLLMDAC